MYCGKLGKAIFFFISFFLIYIFTFYLSYYFGNVFYLSFLFLLFSIYAANIILSFKEANNIFNYKLESYNKWYFYLLFILLNVTSTFLIKTYVIENFNLTSNHMNYNILSGDCVSLNKISSKKIQRGDIVIFRPPHNTKQHFVKRCVALPGDELFVADKNLYLHHREGDEWIKNNFNEEDIVVFAQKLWVKNPYMKEHPGIHHDDKISLNGQYPMPIFNFAPIRVDEDHYFMMGDNRDHSNDSRFWGAVPYENIEGTPWFIYFSIDEDWEIRWDRLGKTPTDLEAPEHLDRAVVERIKKDKDDYGIY
ncbi:signal peptidase I [Sulfurimonas crateris]|uniref:Signal peptidase I n=2 Tax=Sulfurimonas crateris TaxID=2574727 RepID=A0A4U2Z6G5_9BACT|nr:signal peptidase I [Sulfurimonas crateris]TKI69808.1 signal peptidase I [Sulfurimonas crateris]